MRTLDVFSLAAKAEISPTLNFQRRSPNKEIARKGWNENFKEGDGKRLQHSGACIIKRFA